MSYREEKFVKEFNLDLDGMGGFGTAHGGKEPADVEQIIGINEVKTFAGDRRKTAVHFFVDDYQFERVWTNPEKWAEELRSFAWMCSPDFSFYIDVPAAVGVFNTWRNRVICSFWQEKGLNVLPSLIWGEEDTLWEVFDGYAKGGWFAISSTGISSGRQIEIFQNGLEQAVQDLSPEGLVVFGETTFIPQGLGVKIKQINRTKNGKGHKWEVVAQV